MASNRLLFRNVRNLAIGHGCAVEWTDSDAVTELRMSFIPSHDVPRADTAIEGIPQLPMSAFADGQGFALLESLIAGYRDWIESQSRRIAGLSEEHLITTAKAHLSLANAAADRMTDGLAYLRDDPQAMSAFTPDEPRHVRPAEQAGMDPHR